MAAEKTKADKLTDGRDEGEWVSRYPSRAWKQIVLELAYLLALLATVAAALVTIGFGLAEPRQSATSIDIVGGFLVQKDLLQWVIVALSGVIGGIIFDLKWLYHSVAKGLWSVDRVLWRILVPAISGVVSVFLAFVIVSGLIPFVKQETFKTTYFCLGFGFLFGYFSDNVIAALQNFAQKYIGTTRQKDEE